MQKTNKMEVQFVSCSENESFARVAVAAFLSQLDPTVDELYDVKTAVSEAVTNCIIHGYKDDREQNVYIRCSYEGRTAQIEIQDMGQGILDVEAAMKALYTTSSDDERAGLGFTVMQSMMDEVDVASEVGKGTIVRLTKTFS